MKGPILASVVLLALSACGGDPKDDQYAVPPDAGPATADAASPPVSTGLAESLVVCRSCSPELLETKTRGIHAAMADLVAFAGADILPEHGPATFHLSGDGYCGEYEPGMTGYCSADACGRANLCLFDLEKQNRAYAFTPENAVRREDQLLAVHEAVHAWFYGRVANYAIEEPFCKIVSFEISGALSGQSPDPCAWFTPAISYPDRLMHDLCGLGMDAKKAGEVLRWTAVGATDAGRRLTADEFSRIVSLVLDRDATPAFRAAGILP